MNRLLSLAIVLSFGKCCAAFSVVTNPLLLTHIDKNPSNTALSSTRKRNTRASQPSASFADGGFDDDDDWFNQPFDDDEEEIFSSSKRASTSPNRGPRRMTKTKPPPLPSTKTAADPTKPSHFFSRKSLDECAPDDSQQSAIYRQLCQGAGLTRPSKIQTLAWPILRQGQSAIVAEQTGSGKTLAYLIPLIERMLTTAPIKAPGTPRIVVLSPTAELSDQTRAVCDRLSQQAPFNTLVITATGQYNTNIRDQIRKLQRTPVDVLISTPGRLSTILRTRNSGLDLSHVQAIVLDEVDILLLDDTFGPQLRAIGQAAPVDQTQFVFCTATLPDSIVQTVQREFPNVKQIRGPGLHKVAPTVKERLVDVSVPAPHNRNPDFCFDVKAKQLLKALRETRCRRTLIFCNTIETCRMVENLLKRHDRQGQLYQVGAYHNALTSEARQANLRALAQAPDRSRDAILVCTDRAARGVDFGGTSVDHVVVFDFPSDPAEYVRRVGRTARAGRAGTCTVLAYGWQLPIARSVMTQGTLQEFRAAEDKATESLDSDEPDDWSAQERRKQKRISKKKRNDIKESIEDGRLWT